MKTCASCGKSKSDSQFAADGRTKDNLSPLCVDCRFNELETVDLPGVEILAVGGPIHGKGSPPGGDHWTTEDLRTLVDASRELAGELRPPAKIGHDGGQPAVGWLENLRLSDDGTKLLTDVKSVPRKFAELVKARAYRTRSVELQRVTSQKTGKVYSWAVTGLAWLGGRIPAVRTLDDVAALYEGDHAERRFLQFDENEDHDLGRLFELLLTEASGDLGGRSDTPTSVPEKKYTDEQRKTFAEATGLEPAKVTDELLTKAGVPLDQTAPAVTDEQARALAEALGVKAEDDKIDATKLLDAAKAKAKPEPKTDEQRSLEEEARWRELEERAKKGESADERTRKLEEELRVERRTGFITTAIREGRIEPGQREKVEKLYDSDPHNAREFVASLPVNEDFVREYGSDEPTEEQKTAQEQVEKAYEEDLASRMHVKVEEVI